MTRVTQLIHDAGKYLLIYVYPLPTHPTHNFTHKNGGNLETLPGWPKKMDHNRSDSVIRGTGHTVACYCSWYYFRVSIVPPLPCRGQGDGNTKIIMKTVASDWQDSTQLVQALREVSINTERGWVFHAFLSPVKNTHTHTPPPPPHIGSYRKVIKQEIIIYGYLQLKPIMDSVLQIKDCIGCHNPATMALVLIVHTHGCHW